MHPTVIRRFVNFYNISGIADLEKHFNDNYPPAFLRDPLADMPFLLSTKARTDLIPPALSAAGVFGLPYTSYSEIAALMKPEEIHPEVKEKLDQIKQALRL